MASSTQISIEEFGTVIYEENEFEYQNVSIQISATFDTSKFQFRYNEQVSSYLETNIRPQIKCYRLAAYRKMKHLELKRYEFDGRCKSRLTTLSGAFSSSLEIKKLFFFGFFQKNM